MNILISLCISIIPSAGVSVASYFILRKLLLRLAQGPVHLTCSHCGLIVARFEQTADSKIRCANCKRAQERKR